MSLIYRESVSAAELPNSLTLEEAAAQLHCHVETLRRRIRRGELKATRGRHGAYLIDIDDLVRIHPRKGRPVWLPAPLPAEELESSWSYLSHLLWRLHAREELEFMYMLKEEGPELHLPSYRLLTVHRLRLAGRTYAEIATELGISVRHASRLDKIHPVVALRASLLRLAHRKIRERVHARVQEHERVLAQLRARLDKEGIHPSTLTRADLVYRKHPLPRALRKRSRLATVRPERTRQQIQILKDAGLTIPEIEAILAIGLTPDELNALMLRGLGPARPPARRMAASE